MYDDDVHGHLGCHGRDFCVLLSPDLVYATQHVFFFLLTVVRATKHATWQSEELPRNKMFAVWAKKKKKRHTGVSPSDWERLSNARLDCFPEQDKRVTYLHSRRERITARPTTPSSLIAKPNDCCFKKSPFVRLLHRPDGTTGQKCLP